MMVKVRARRSAPHSGDCVRVPDGRIGRVRGRSGPFVKVRVRRQTSDAHELLMCDPMTLKRVDCPKGWMSPQGYQRYLRITLRKMRERAAAKLPRGHRHG
jgi:hypothetical protein